MKTLLQTAFGGSFLVTFYLSCFSSAGMDLVKAGRPAATIVSTSTPEPPAQKAGRQPSRKPQAAIENDEAAAVRVIQDWIKKMTGAELPVADKPGEGTPAIYVGRAAIAAGLKLDDIASPTAEGIRIQVEDRRLLLAGQSAAATLKAACRLLEELGCRYFMEGAIGEEYPTTQNLGLSPRMITESPGLRYRNPKGPSWRDSLWKSWNGAGGTPIQHQHAWGSYVKESVFQTHPEFFAMGADGQRKPGQWLCTSNPELRKYFAAQVIAAIKGGNKNPSLSPTDGRGYCQCPACKAQDDPNSREPSSGTVSISNRYVDFFDEVARQVAAECPDSILSFYCYADYTQPPTFSRKLSPNLCAVIAPIRYCRTHEIGCADCPSREQQVGMIEGWASRASRLGYYNYMYNLADATLPFFKFTACQKEFPFLKAKGLDMMTIEVLSNWHIYGPQIYLSLRLAYQPQADARAIMEDYWAKFYGPAAAPLMQDYWLGIDAAQGRLASHSGGFFGLSQIYTPEFLTRCATRLEKAARAAENNPKYAARVALHAEGFQSAREYSAIVEAMKAGDFVRANTIYNQMIQRLEAIAAKGWANREYGTAYLKRFLGKIITEGAAATAPPNRLAQVLPDTWRFCADDADEGLNRKFAEPAFDDSPWQKVTWNKTLDAQGFDKNTILWYRTAFNAPAKTQNLQLFFAEVDGYTEVFVNGQRMEIPAAAQSNKPSADGRTQADVRAKPRTPFTVRIAAAAKPGLNTLALRVDHTRITDLALGGILRPVLLVDGE